MVNSCWFRIASQNLFDQKRTAICCELRLIKIVRLPQKQTEIVGVITRGSGYSSVFAAIA